MRKKNLLLLFGITQLLGIVAGSVSVPLVEFIFQESAGLGAGFIFLFFQAIVLLISSTILGLKYLEFKKRKLRYIYIFLVSIANVFIGFLLITFLLTNLLSLYYRSVFIQ